MAIIRIASIEEILASIPSIENEQVLESVYKGQAVSCLYELYTRLEEINEKILFHVEPEKAIKCKEKFPATKLKLVPFTTTMTLVSKSEADSSAILMGPFGDDDLHASLASCKQVFPWKKDNKKRGQSSSRIGM